MRLNSIDVEVADESLSVSDWEEIFRNCMDHLDTDEIIHALRELDDEEQATIKKALLPEEADEE